MIVRDKEAYHQQTTERMNKHFELPSWSVKQKLALTCRILAAEGHDSGLAGQATARGEKLGTDGGWPIGRTSRGRSRFMCGRFRTKCGIRGM